MDYSSDEWIFVGCEQIRNEFIRKYSLYFYNTTQNQKNYCDIFRNELFRNKRSHIFNAK